MRLKHAPVSPSRTSPPQSLLIRLQLRSKLGLFKLLQLCDEEAVGLGELSGEAVVDRLLVLEDANDEADLLPQSQASGEAFVKLVNFDAELTVNADAVLVEV